MRKLILWMGVFCFCSCATKTSLPKAIEKAKEINLAQDSMFRIGSPIIEIDSILFQNRSTIEMKLNHPGAEIFYSLDGTDVSQESMKYDGVFILKGSANIRAKTFHPAMQESELAEQSIYKTNKLEGVESIVLSTQAHENYPGGGASSLLDLKKGSLNFREGDFWSGFQEEEIGIDIQLLKENEINRISLSVLEDHGSWIFMPAEVTISSDGEVIVKKELELAAKENPSSLKFITLNLKAKKLYQIRIVIRNHASIPDWHAGKGTAPWLFIDEIIFE